MKTIFSIILILFTLIPMRAQEFDQQIAKAKSAYDAGNYEESRFAVQNALHEINVKIGQEVLKVLPEKVNDMPCNPTSDQMTGSGTDYAGLFINRIWEKTEAGHLEFSLISDSPLMKTVNTFLALPLVMGGADSNQKKIKVEGYKAMLEKNIDENSNVTGYSLMLPYSNTLLQLNYTGSTTEEAFMAMVNQIPVAKVTSIAQ